MNTYAIVKNGGVVDYPVTSTSRALSSGEQLLPCLFQVAPPVADTKYLIPVFRVESDRVVVTYRVLDLSLDQMLEKIRPYITRDKRLPFVGYVPSAELYRELQRQLEVGIRNRLNDYAKKNGASSLEALLSLGQSSDLRLKQRAEMALTWSRTVWNSYYAYYQSMLSGVVRFPHMVSEVYTSIGLGA